MPLTCFVICLYCVSWSNVFWIVVCDGLLPTVKAGSNVSMSPSTATTSVSIGVLATARRRVRVAARATPVSEPPAPSATAAAALLFRSSSRVSRPSNTEAPDSTDALSLALIIDPPALRVRKPAALRLQRPRATHASPSSHHLPHATPWDAESRTPQIALQGRPAPSHLRTSFTAYVSGSTTTP